MLAKSNELYRTQMQTSRSMKKEIAAWWVA